MRVALYARVSSKVQEKKGTIASQIEALRNHATAHDFEIDENYVCTDEGYSGALLARPELDRLRDGAQAGAFDAVLVLSPDRLSRKYAYLILILEEFERFGTPVVFLEQPPPEDPQSALLVQIQGAVAEYERAKLTERYRRGKLYRARQGEIFWTSVPYGYHHVPRQGDVAAHLMIHDAEAEVVSKIFRWHADESISIRQIAKRLSRENIPTPMGNTRWGESSVHKILRRDAYLGTLHYNRSKWEISSGADGQPVRYKKLSRPKSEWIAITIPSIIDRETFERSQARHGKNQQFSPRNLKREQWLLRRLLRCERCGYRCACVTAKKTTRRPQLQLHYYRCGGQGRLSARPTCRPNHYCSQPVDDLVWKEIRRHLLNPELLLKAQTILRNGGSVDESFLSAQLNNARKRLSQLHVERHRLLDAFQGGFLDKEEFEHRASQVMNRIHDLEADIRGLEDENKHVSEGKQLLTRMRDFTNAIARKLDDMSFQEKQTLARTVLSDVIINGDTVKLLFKIPLPRVKKTLSGEASKRTSGALSRELDLRSHRDHRRGLHSRGRVSTLAGAGHLHPRRHRRALPTLAPHAAPPRRASFRGLPQ
jgi:site-specific DNA recombinase